MREFHEIPSADDYKPIQESEADQQQRYDDWLNAARRSIAHQIKDGEKSLRDGHSIRIVCPTMRDTGVFSRMWNRYLDVLVRELESKGWQIIDSGTLVIGGNQTILIRSFDAQL